MKIMFLFNPHPAQCSPTNNAQIEGYENKHA